MSDPMMGRPSLGVQPTLVRLSDEARMRIRMLVGDRGLSQFIREAIDNELARRERAVKRAKRNPDRP